MRPSLMRRLSVILEAPNAAVTSSPSRVGSRHSGEPPLARSPSIPSDPSLGGTFRGVSD